MPEKYQDLAKRWLRAKRTELLTGNRRERENADAEADSAQRQLSDHAINQAAREVSPSFARWQDNQAERETAAAERERTEILALPRAAVDISVIGPWGNGSWQGEFPARVERERDDDTGEVTLRVELDTPDDLAPRLAGQPLYALRLALRPYTGPGRYDPATLRDEIDAMDYSVEYAYREEAFFWTPDAGPGMLEITAGEKQLDLGLPMQGAAGDLRVTATITLPSIRDPQAERAAADAEQRRAYFAALPRAAVQVAVTGPAATGSWSGELAAIVSDGRAGGDRPATLQVMLATPDVPAPQLAGLPFAGLRLEVPQYTGAGHYDLAAHSDEPDPEANMLVLGDEDEPFSWTPRVGPGTVDVGADGRTLEVRLAMRGVAGDLQLTAAITLPAAGSS